MELIDLEILKAVAEEGGVTKAAKRLSMTQPGISQHLKKLEDEFGAKLFNREKNRLVLNDAGRKFLIRSQKVLDEVKKLKEPYDGPSEDVEGVLKLGLTDASTQTVIPPRLKEFRDLFPKVHLELIVSESEEIENGVIRGRYDIGVISGMDAPHPQLQEEVLHSDRIDCLVSNQGPLSKLNRITLEELTKWPLIMYPKKSRTRQIIDTAFRKNGLAPTEVLDVWYIGAAVKLSEAGLGIAMISRFFIENELLKHKCHHVRIVGDPFKRNICVIRKKGEWMSEPAYQFYKLLMKK